MESRKSRRSFIQSCAVAGTLAGLHRAASVFAGAGQYTGGAPRPNILVIMTDDHAAHAISSYGSRINTTPQMDRLAAEGMRFSNCFCTNSICAPSRATILTGKYGHLNSMPTNIGSTFDGSQITFPKLLQQSGYQTALFGKWHLVSNPTGFDQWEVLPGQGEYYNPAFITPQGRIQRPGYVTDIITDLSLEWLQQQRDPNRPFLLMCHHKAPHRWWEPNLKHLHMYENADIPEPDDLFDDYATRSPGATENGLQIAKTLNDRDLKLVPMDDQTPEQREAWETVYGPRNKAAGGENTQGRDLARWKYQRYIKDYLRCVASVDENIGRMLEYLDASGLAGNTMVVYTSDQGFFLGDHGYYDKRIMYEEALRMPLLIRYPGVISPGSVNSELVLNLDFAETFLDAAGIEIPRDMQGRSMLPLLRGKTPDDWRQSLWYHYYEYPRGMGVKRHYGIRTRRYKLIHFYHDIDAWELYDLEHDPGERNNLYGNPAYDGLVKQLQSEMSTLRHQYGDTDESTREIETRYEQFLQQQQRRR